MMDGFSRDSIVEEYKAILGVNESEEVLTISFLKLARIFDAIDNVSDMLYGLEISEMEALIRMDVLTGAVAEVRSDIKNQL